MGFPDKIAYDITSLDKLSFIGMYGNDRISIKADKEDAWSRGAESFNANSYTLVFGSRYRKLWKGGYTELIAGTVETRIVHEVFEVVVDTLTGARYQRKSYDNNSTETVNQLHVLWTGKIHTVDELSAGVTLKPILFKYKRWLEQDTIIYDDITGDWIPDTLLRKELNIDESAASLKYGGFTEYRWRPGDNLSILAGIRLDGFEYSKEITIAPRISMDVNISQVLSLNLAFGKYYQSHAIFTYTSDPNGSNRYLPHPESTQYVLGLNYLLRESTLLSIESYYKNYRNLAVSERLLLEEENPTFRSWRWLAIGRKRAWGLELFAQQKLQNNWYGTLSYSFSQSEFDDSGSSYPSDYDFPHISTLVLGYKFNSDLIRRFQRHWYGWWTYALPVNGDELTASTRFRYVSGRPYTSRIWTTDGLEYPFHWEEAEEDNNARYPEYVRWEIRWDSKWFSEKTAVVTFLEVQNMLNRKNVAEYIYTEDGEIDAAYQFRFFFVGGFRVEW